MTQSHDVESEAKGNDTLQGIVPLVVDLDGSLLRTDLLLESAFCLINQRPWLVLWIPLWLLRGRAYLKRRIFQQVQLDVSLLPFNEELLAWLRNEKARGRSLILATASDNHQACRVVEPLALFDMVLGSDGQRNLKGREKLKTIVAWCGEKFDYVGNSSADLAIWRHCRHAILVNASRRVQSSARRAGNVVRVFPPSPTPFRDLLRSMRLAQWAKNLLIFVPAIVSQTIFDGSVLGAAALAFLSFGFAASAAYILNDLLDLEEDRRHTTKKTPPPGFGPDVHRLRHPARIRMSFGQRSYGNLASRRFFHRAVSLPHTGFDVLTPIATVSGHRRFGTGFTLYAARRRRPPGNRCAFFFLAVVLRLFSAFLLFSLALSQQTAISALADTPLGLRAFPAAERCDFIVRNPEGIPQSGNLEEEIYSVCGVGLRDLGREVRRIERGLK